MKPKKELEELKQQLQQQVSRADLAEQQNLAKEKQAEELEQRVLDLEALLKKKEEIIQDIDAQRLELQDQFENSILTDKGQQTLLGFKLVPPYLDRILGRPFMITISQEFEYAKAPDIERLNERYEQLKASEDSDFHNFRDRIKPGHSMRVVYFYSSRDYFVDSPNGKIPTKEFMFPPDLASGVEITSHFRSAMYLAIQYQELQAAVLPQQLFGAPLLSYAFPIIDDHDRPIGAVSFSNDISSIVSIAKELGKAVEDESDVMLENLANVLDEELEAARQAADLVRQEALTSQRIADVIRTKGKEVIEISERLNVLAINTAIESSKVGAQGKGVGVIANQMKQISDITGRTLKEIFDESTQLDASSKQILEHSNGLENSAAGLKEESAILFNTSKTMSNQKHELTNLVQMSIEEITQNQGDFDAIKKLIQ